MHRESPTGRVIIVIVAERGERRQEREERRERERRKRTTEKRKREENPPSPPPPLFLPSLLSVCRFKTSPCVLAKRAHVELHTGRFPRAKPRHIQTTHTKHTKHKKHTSHTLSAHTHNHFNTHAQHTTCTHTYTHHSHTMLGHVHFRQPTVILREFQREGECLDMRTAVNRP